LRRIALLLLITLVLSPIAHADEAAEAQQELREAQALYSGGQYFRAARYAFSARQKDPGVGGEAYSWITLSLVKAGLENAGAYFFVRTLQSGDKPAIQRVLTQTQPLLAQLGGDLLRKYLVRHTKYEDYDPINRSAFLFALGKDALLAGDEERAIGYLNGIPASSKLWPFALQLRGTAFAVQGRGEHAIRDFAECASRAEDIQGYRGANERRRAQARREADDLRSRCIAGQARTLYQMDRFEDADRTYDRIPKASLVWPDILFEQAWNSFARREYNRTLGKLVSYKSPALAFVFNTEVDVLRAQSFLLLCLYNDANDVINEFNSRYSKVGEEVKRFVEGNSSNLGAFYELGKNALRGTIYARSEFHKMTNRFVRGPYFQNLVAAERDVTTELSAVRQFAQAQAGVNNEPGQGFPGFLEQVLRWRVRSIQLLGGAFVKNSLIDYHQALISDFEKMAFIKLEMLGRAKDQLLSRKERSDEERGRGAIEPSRRDDQYLWGFNGEFWSDELGDYVFGLKSECKS